MSQTSQPQPQPNDQLPADHDGSPKFSRFWKRGWVRIAFLLSVMGPGLITATVDNDAGGIATYSLAGAHYGLSLNWTLLPILVLLIITMEMSARLGAVTGQGLADLFRERFGVKVTFWVLMMVLVANFGTIVSEFSGIASSIEIIGANFGYGEEAVNLKYILIPLLAFGIWKLITEYDYKKIEKFFLLSIVFYLAYPISAYLSHPDWTAAVTSLVKPTYHFEAGYLALMIGTIGTTITPWMQFYLQSTLIEKGVTMKNYRATKWDVTIGCITTVAVSYSIILACSATLCRPGIAPVSTIEEIGKSLAPLAGPYAGFLFAFGLFNASLFGAAVLPLSTSFAICEGMGWERGMNKTYEEAPLFYLIFTSLIVIGAAMVLLPGMQTLYLSAMRMSQVAQGLILPPFLYYLVKLGDDRALLGAHANSLWLSRFSWFCVGVLTIIDILMLFMTVREIIG